MRRLILILLSAALTALIAARAALPEPAIPTAAATPRYGYNILPIDLPIVPETAGSALIAEMNGYYLFRTPTAKHALTGALRGQNLLFVCADSFVPDEETAARLEDGGARFSEVYLPDWYQGAEGRDFALLSGLMPTNVYGASALAHAGEQDIYLPYALPRALSAEGYACYADLPDDGLREAYAALGFSHVQARTDTAASLSVRAGSSPFFIYCRLEGSAAGRELTALLDALDAAKLREDTAVCVYTASDEARGARLFLLSGRLADTACAVPCSDLDLTPTLLDLFGVAYDSRFLSGRDVFAPNTDGGTPGDTTPLVSLSGSAYTDWVTDAGGYTAAERAFVPADGARFDGDTAAAYVRAVNELVYDRYVFARRIMENNYFHLVPGA